MGLEKTQEGLRQTGTGALLTPPPAPYQHSAGKPLRDFHKPSQWLPFKGGGSSPGDPVGVEGGWRTSFPSEPGRPEYCLAARPEPVDPEKSGPLSLGQVHGLLGLLGQLSHGGDILGSFSTSAGGDLGGVWSHPFSPTSETTCGSGDSGDLY